MGSAGDDSDRLAVAADGRPMTGNRALAAAQPDQHPIGSLLLHLEEGLATSEVALIQLHRPAQTGLVGVRLLVHVIAVEAQSRLQPADIPRRQPGRRGAGRQQAVPHGRRALGGEIELETVLAGIARTRDCRRPARDLSLDHSEVGDRGQIEIGCQGRQNRFRAWTLERQQGGVRAAVQDLDARAGVVTHPVHVLLTIGGVHHRRPGAIRKPVDDQVVEHAAGLVADEVVLGVTGLHLRQIVGDQSLQIVRHAVAPEADPAHVADVEKAGRLAHGGVLLAHAGVLLRHLPAGEVHHASAQRPMPLVERRALRHPRGLRSRPEAAPGPGTGAGPHRAGGGPP